MQRIQHNIPDDFEKYFWDCNFQDLEFSEHQTFIIERILMFGNLKDILWLKRTYGIGSLLKTASSSRRLDQKTKNFWNIYFNVSP
ncbi:MAG: hypothetical protein U9N53_07785 [Bacteroidota bacterium]|nr:hypothetical protein [Bacteroidota bacterium]